MNHPRSIPIANRVRIGRRSLLAGASLKPLLTTHLEHVVEIGREVQRERCLHPLVAIVQHTDALEDAVVPDEALALQVDHAFRRGRVAEQWQRVERFKFYSRHAWKPGAWRWPLRATAQWRCRHDWYDLPVEKLIVDFVRPPQQAS